MADNIITITVHDEIDTKTIRLPRSYLEQIPYFRCIFTQCSEETTQDHIVMPVPTAQGVWHMLNYWNTEWKHQLELSLASNFLLIDSDISYLRHITVPESEFPSLLRIIELFGPCVETALAFNNNLPPNYDLSSISREFLTGIFYAYRMAFYNSQNKVINVMHINRNSRGICDERIYLPDIARYCIQYSPDRRMIAYPTTITISHSTGTNIIDAHGRLLCSINSDAQRLEFSPDSKYIVSCNIHNSVDIVDAENGKIIVSNPYGALCVAYSPDGNQFALGCYDYTVCICCSKTGTVLHIKGCGSRTRCICYSSDGKSLATGDYGGIKIWSIETLQIVMVLEGNGRIADLEYTPDCSKIISSDIGHNQGTNIRIWDAVTGKLLHAISRKRNCFMIDPAGRQIICGRYKHIDIIDIETGSTQSIECQIDVGASLDYIPMLDEAVRKRIAGYLSDPKN